MFSTFLFLESYSFLSLCKRWKKGMYACLLYVSHSALEPSSKSILSCFLVNHLFFREKKTDYFVGLSILSTFASDLSTSCIEME